MLTSNSLPSVAIILLGLLSLPQSSLQQANNSTNITSFSNETSCGEESVFTARTEFILEGRNDLFDSLERNALEAAFVEIYNMITRESCDSSFRRISSLDFLSMSNSLNETITFQDTDLLSLLDGPPQDGPLQQAGEGPPLQQDGPPPRDQQQQQQEEQPQPPQDDNNNDAPLPPPPRPPPRPQMGPFGRMRRQLNDEISQVNSTKGEGEEGVSVTYGVTGRCRDCAVAGSSASFALYDDSFRLRVRYLVQQETRALIPPRDNQGPPRLPASTGAEEDDCTCAAGLEPSMPQAPKIPELLDFLNERLQKLQEQHGLFENIQFQNIVQLDGAYDPAIVFQDNSTNVAVQAEENKEVNTPSLDSSVDEVSVQLQTEDQSVAKSASSPSTPSKGASTKSGTRVATSTRVSFLMLGMMLWSVVQGQL